MRGRLDLRGEHHTSRRRQDEIRGQLELAGSSVRHLRECLQDLGPIFQLFGLYLSTRVDLLPAMDCLELGLISDAGQPTPYDALLNVIEIGLGREPQAVFGSIEETPFQCSHLWQWHRAQLLDGTPVDVKIAHPEFPVEMEQLSMLGLLTETLERIGIPLAGINHAIANFTEVLPEKYDVTREAAALQSEVGEAAHFDSMTVICHASGQGVLTILRADDISLASVLAAALAPGSNLTMLRGGSAVHKGELAYQLCKAWLRSVFAGRLYAVDQDPQEVGLQSGPRIVRKSGRFANLPEGSNSNLWNYLTAVCAMNPDRAQSLLTKELHANLTEAANHELLQRFRQVVPFRDGGWSLSGANASLAETMFVQWRLASTRGLLPGRELTDFYRGLFSVAKLAYSLAPERDVLAEAVRDGRLAFGLESLNGFLTPEKVREQADQYSELVATFPQMFDEFLAVASTRDWSAGNGQANGGPSRASSSNVVLGWILGVIAILVLANHFYPDLKVVLLNSPISAIVFLVAGVMALRMIDVT